LFVTVQKMLVGENEDGHNQHHDNTNPYDKGVTPMVTLREIH
jgi:hypothetical protein